MSKAARILSRHTITAVACLASIAGTALFGFVPAFGVGPDHINFKAPALPPMGHSLFCLHYPDDCTIHGGGRVALTKDRVTDLRNVNSEVNRHIVPTQNVKESEAEAWRVSPRIGDCNDYAVTKRHQLLAQGWPSNALLLSEVVVPSGEHHLVLVVRTEGEDLVLDNLDSDIQPVARTHYQQWVRVESPDNPKFWSTVSVPSA